MNNVKTNGILANLQALGLIDENNKVTVEGIDVLTRYAEHESNAETQTDEDEWEPEYSQTWNMDCDEVSEWEENKHSIKVQCADDWLEVIPTRLHHIGELGQKIYSNEVLFISMTSINPFEECSAIMESKKEIIKLRDYLTKFIEKDEDWYKIEENN